MKVMVYTLFYPQIRCFAVAIVVVSTAAMGTASEAIRKSPSVK
jgi:hypothetical protein